VPTKIILQLFQVQVTAYKLVVVVLMAKMVVSLGLKLVARLWFLQIMDMDMGVKVIMQVEKILIA
tara:strand:- start:347 stop:541 length:195 start_codon:yes stop_codon:yes gene_type:complete